MRWAVTEPSRPSISRVGIRLLFLERDFDTQATDRLIPHDRVKKLIEGLGKICQFVPESDVLVAILDVLGVKNGAS
jgi:hypothetical protein